MKRLFIAALVALMGMFALASSASAYALCGYWIYKPIYCKAGQPASGVQAWVNTGKRYYARANPDGTCPPPAPLQTVSCG
jgi:hypothetical protein